MFLKHYIVTLFMTCLAVLAAAGLCGTASAQSETLFSGPASYSALQTTDRKTILIEQARMGDAEALYQLGLLHMSGREASLNDKVAARFFHYAAQKGHISAQQQLNLILPAPIATSKVRSAAPKSKIVKPNKVSEDILNAEAAEAALKAQKRAETKAKRQAEKRAERQAKRQAALEAKRAAQDEARARKKEQQKQQLMRNQQAAAEQVRQAEKRKAIVAKIAEDTQELSDPAPHIKVASSDEGLPPVISKVDHKTESFRGVMQGTITAILLILMFLSMVFMGRRLKD